MSLSDTKHGAVSRRMFLKTAAAAVGSIGLGSVLAGCTSPQQTAPTAAPAAPAVASTAAAAAPSAAPVVAKAKRGGTLKIAVDTFNAPTTFPPRTSMLTKFATSIPYEMALYAKPDQFYEVAPGLAESWTMSPDAKQWTFKIRKGVPWDKGQGEVTADDILYTIQLITRPDSKHGDLAFWRPRIKNLKVVDPYTLTYAANVPEPDLPFAFSPWTHLQIVCKKYVEAAGDDKADREPVGSGPFRVVSYTEGTQLAYEAIGDTHWRVAPKWDRIEFQAVPEAATRFALLKSGRADLVVLAKENIAEAQKDFMVITTPDTIEAAMFFGGLLAPDNPKYKAGDPWQDVRVREAMNIAIDRQAINKTFFAGLGTYEPLLGANLRPPGATDSLFMKQIPYDPERAKQLLKDAGKTSFNFKLITCPSPGFENAAQVAEAVAGYWEAIGIKATITPMDRLAFRSTYWQEDNTSGMIWPWATTNTPDGAGNFNKFFYSKSAGLRVISDGHLDSLYGQLQTTIDPDKRTQIITDAQVYGLKQWGAIHLVNLPNSVYAANKDKIAGWKSNASAAMAGWEYIEPKL